MPINEIDSVPELPEGNEYVENLGGRDLMAQPDTATDGWDDTETSYEVPLPETDPEQRRAAALQAAQSLGLNSVGDLLSASKQIEDYLNGGGEA